MAGAEQLGADRLGERVDWFRWYLGTCTDAKLHKAARAAGVRRSAVIAAWAAVLEEARRNGDDGDLEALDPSWLACQIEEPSNKCKRIIEGMREVGLVRDLNVPAFSHRQFTSDNSTVRVRAHRAKRLKNRTPSPPGNVSVTESETHQNRTDSILDSSLRSESETPAASDQPDLDALFYKRGKALLGKKAGGQLTKLRAACGSVGVALEIIDKAQHKDSPAEYVAGCIRNRGNGHVQHRTGNQRASVVEAIQWLDERREEDLSRARDDAPEGEVRKLERR